MKEPRLFRHESRSALVAFINVRGDGGLCNSGSDIAVQK